MTNHGKETTES